MCHAVFMRLQCRPRLAAELRSSALILVVALGMGGCALMRDAGFEDARPGATGSDSSTASPGGSIVDALPDPLHGDRHTVGEEVSLPDGSVVYLGMSRSAGQIVARFQMVRGSLPANTRMGTADGALVEFTRDGDLLESEPFGNEKDPPARESIITLVVGEQLIPFEAGKLRDEP